MFDIFEISLGALFLIGFAMFLAVFWEDRIKDVAKLFFFIGLSIITSFFIACGIKLIIQN